MHFHCTWADGEILETYLTTKTKQNQLYRLKSLCEKIYLALETTCDRKHTDLSLSLSTV